MNHEVPVRVRDGGADLQEQEQAIVDRLSFCVALIDQSLPLDLPQRV